jgi:CHAT domain-containing protein
MRAAVDAVERSSGTFAMPELRAAFMADKWQPYLELARLENALGRHDAAFAVSERLRAQELLELLSRARVVTATDSAGLAEEQELRQRVSDLTYRLAGAEPELAMYRGPALVGRDQAEVREALAVAEERYASVLERQRAGAASSGSARALVSAASVRGTLKPDEVFVEYLLSDSAGTAFVVTPDTLAALDLGVGRRTLANLIDFARGTMTADSGPQSTLWRAPLRRLYQYLIQPIDRAGLLAGKHRLILAPHAELHYLPFATLIAPGPGEQFLVQRYAITYTPSASVWSRLAARDSASAPRGMLALAPVGREALPGAEAEVRGMGRLFPGAAVRLGPEATESAFKRAASSYQFLHIATLGVLNKQNPLFSYVALRPGGEEDGRLEVHEVLNLSLHSRLVVLSACQTGLGSGALGDVPPGDDWVGLVQAFLYAGSAKVLATAWPIVDRATDPLMRGFYRRLQAGVTEDMALAMEQRAAIADPRLRHPRFWGPFMLTGGR